jgi:hypothetical protein
MVLVYAFNVGACGCDTVTVALPLEVPEQFASLTAVMMYVVVLDGETVRVADAELTVCCAPSDHDRFHGAVPVSDIAMLADWPGQMVLLPLTAAVGAAPPAGKTTGDDDMVADIGVSAVPRQLFRAVTK